MVMSPFIAQPTKWVGSNGQSRRADRMNEAPAASPMTPAPRLRSLHSPAAERTLRGGYSVSVLLLVSRR
jgi:hypothetical protein